MKYILLMAGILTMYSCSKEDEGHSLPTGFRASDGTSVGTIHIDFTKDDNVGSVRVERRELGSNVWVQITGTGVPFDDTHGYANGLPPGKVFEYRLRNDWPDDAEYTSAESGYAYDIIPVTEIEISSSNTSHSLRWNEANNTTFQNESEIFFSVYRSDDLLGPFMKVATVGEDRTYFDDLLNKPDLQGIKLYYRVDVYYDFYTKVVGTYRHLTDPVEGTVVGTN